MKDKEFITEFETIGIWRRITNYLINEIPETNKNLFNCDNPNMIKFINKKRS